MYNHWRDVYPTIRQRDEFEAICRANDIKNGSQRCFNPDHADRNPSMSVSFSKAVFHCFSCEWKGNVYDLKKFLGMQSHSKRLVKNKKWQLRSQVKSKPRGEATKQTISNERKHQIFKSLMGLIIPNTKARKYLLSRCIDDRIIFDSRIRCWHDVSRDPSAMARHLKTEFSIGDLKSVGLLDARDDFAFAKYPILIPYFDENRNVVNIQGRTTFANVKPKYLFLKGSRQIVYGLANLESERIIICEGVMDSLSFMTIQREKLLSEYFEKYFLHSVIGIPSANFSFSEKHLRKFYKKDIVLFLDNDSAGEKFKNNFKNEYSRVNHHSIEISILKIKKHDGEKKMDINDLLMKEKKNG